MLGRATRQQSMDDSLLPPEGRQRSMLTAIVIALAAVVSASAVILTFTQGIAFGPAILGAIGLDLVAYNLWIRSPRDPGT